VIGSSTLPASTMLHDVRFMIGAVSLLLSQALQAQAPPDPFTFHNERLDSARKVQMLGQDGFGEQIGLQTGQLAFETTDVDLPGNSGLPVRFTRRFEVHDSRAALRGHELGDWSIVLPSLRGQFSTEWLAGTSNLRCSNATPPPQPPPGPPELGEFTLSDYWQGVRLEIPGVTNSEILVPSAALPLANPNHRWTTTDGQVRLRCRPTLANPPASGEGFEAITAEGVIYRFDWLTSRAALTRYKQGYENGGARVSRNLPIREQILYATRIEDRFGNWVEFDFDESTPARLTAIRGNNAAGTEPRLISVDYDDGRVSQVSANGRAWTYHYGYDAAPQQRRSLDQVTLPDGSQWTYQFAVLAYAPILPIVTEPGEPHPGCTGIREPENMYHPPRVGTVTHPAGATASYAIGLVEHRRSNVTLSCENVRVWTNGVNDPADDYPFYPFLNVSWSLLEKTVSVPGGDSYQWQYVYDNEDWASYHLYSGTTEAWPVCNAATQPCHLPACTSDGCAGYSETIVVRPDQSREVYRFGTAWQYNEG
jgi:hypothetical protein